ncbi:MAG: flagellar protein FlgN [Woeseiaceae bacterium]|nr:flagellar protein FlgN [Woeseiaceae bacterium]
MNRPTPQEARSGVVAVLNDSVAHALELKGCLESERSALERQDADALETIVATKSQWVEQLKSLEDRRSKLCEAAGFSAGPTQMDELTSWCDENDAISGRWDRLMSIAADCNSINLGNGAIIRLRRNHVDASLAVLRGAEQEDSTYRSSGDNANAMMKRSLARA